MHEDRGELEAWIGSRSRREHEHLRELRKRAAVEWIRAQQDAARGVVNVEMPARVELLRAIAAAAGA